MDFLEVSLEEIALEGLDGITIPALWIRLETRKPKFTLKLDDKSKQYIWKYLVKENDLRFYELKKARPPLQLYDRFDYTDPETNICIERDDLPDDIYPINVVRDGDIVGSCSTYTTRKDVTDTIRGYTESVHNILKEWGERLVIVASQNRRIRALLGPEVYSKIDLTDTLYCIVERIGRSRWNGEVTQGKDSLKVFKASSKTMYYYRKILKRHNLVTVQVFNIRLNKSNNTYGKLIHLRRFFVERCPVYLGWLQKLTHALDAKPNKMEVLNIMREESGLNQKVFKKLYQAGEKYLHVDEMLHREIYPDAPAKEYLVKNLGHERFIRVIKLKKLYKYKVGGLNADEDDDEDHEEEEGGDSDKEDSSACQDSVQKWERLVEEPLLRQVYAFIRNYKTTGVSQLQLANAFGVTNLEARQLCRNLERRKVVKKVMKDKGKQKVHLYMAMDLLLQSEEHEEFQKMKEEVIGGDPDDDSTSDTEKIEMFHKKKKSSYMTFRSLKRSSIALEIVKENKLVDNTYYIQKKIQELEEKEGIKTKFDKKSMMRILERLSEKGKLQLYRPTVTIGDEEKKLLFVIDNSVKLDDPLVTAAVESSTCRQMAVSCKLSTQQQAFMQKSVDVDNPNISLLRSNVQSRHMVYDSDAGKRYGFVPRMKRCNTMHKLMWYLVYGYNKENLTDEESKPQHDHNRATYDFLGLNTLPAHVEETDSAGGGDAPIAISHLKDDSILKDVKVYKEEYTWRRFIPPLPTHKERGPGWVMLGDILLRMPLYMYCQVVRFNYKVDSLDEFLKHPVRRYLPISQLPYELRQQLMIGRKYMHSTYDVLMNMCGMGLVSFGIRGLKVKEQAFVHIHKNVSIIDTRHSEIRPRMELQLNTNKDLNAYWYHLEVVCLNTRADDIVVGKQQVSKGLSSYPRFREALREKSSEEIPDDGSIPGDGLGVAGLDSGFWAHLKRNWYCNADSYVTLDNSRTQQGKRKGVFSMNSESSAKKRMEDNDLSSDNNDVADDSPKGTKIKELGLKREVPDSKDVKEDETAQLWKYFDRIKSTRRGLQTVARCTLCGCELKQPDRNIVTMYLHMKTRHREIKDLPNIYVGEKVRKEDLVCDFLMLPFHKSDKDGKQKRRSSVWRYMDCVEGTNRARCKICGTDVIFISKSTSHLKRHLVRFHVDYIVETEKLDPSTESPGTIADDAEITKTDQEIGPVLDSGTNDDITDVTTSHLSSETVSFTGRTSSANSNSRTAKKFSSKLIQKARLIVDQSKVTPGGKVGIKHKPMSHVMAGSKSTARKGKTINKSPYKNYMSRAPYYDEVDKEALKQMTKQRISWTPQEDSLLLLCYVAHVIMVGERRDFIVPFACVRDLMHSSFTTSADKTSKACQRRLRYMLKKKDSLNSVYAFVGEAIMDTTIWNTFKKDRKYSKSGGVNRCEKIFLTLVASLREKFKEAHDVPRLTLPSTLDELTEQYEVILPDATPPLRHTDPKNQTEIHFSVLHNIIHSAMLLSDKSNYTFQLYQIFQQYPDTLLMAVFFSMRDDQMVSKIKSYVKTSPRTMLKSTTIPSVRMGAYQMAQKYTYNWYTRYPRRVFPEAGEKMSQIVSLYREKTISASEEVNTTKTARGQVETVKTRQMKMTDTGGCCCMVVTLMAQKRIRFETIIPENIVVIDSSASKAPTRKRRKKTATGSVGIGTTESDEEVDKLIEEAEEGDVQGTARHLGAARVNLSLARCKNSEFIYLQPTDHVVVKACTVNVAMIAEDESLRSPEETSGDDWQMKKDIELYNTSQHVLLHPKTCTSFLNRLRFYIPAAVNMDAFWLHCEEKQFSVDDMSVTKDIYDVVKSREVHGIPDSELRELYGQYPELDKYLGVLEDQRVVVRVGVNVLRYVSHDYLRPWIIHSYRIFNSSSSKYQYDESGDIHSGWMDDILLTGSSYNPYKESADKGNKRRAERQKKEREAVEKEFPWLVQDATSEESVEDQDKQSNIDAREKTSKPKEQSKDDAAVHEEPTVVPSTSNEENEESTADRKLTTLVECVSAIKFVDTEQKSGESGKDEDEPGDKRRKLSTTDDDSDMDPIKYEDETLEEEQTVLKVRPLLERNATFSARGARIRLPQPPPAKPAILQPNIPIRGDLRIRPPVGVPPNIQRPQRPLSSQGINTTLATDTKLVSSTGTAKQLKKQINLLSSPPHNPLLSSPGTISSVSSTTVTSAVRSVITDTSQVIVSPSTAATITDNLKTTTAPHTSGSPGSQKTPVCSGMSVPESFSDTVSFTTAATVAHTPTSGGAPTVTTRPGGQALIFTPQKPLQLADYPRAQFSTIQTGGLSTVRVSTAIPLQTLNTQQKVVGGPAQVVSRTVIPQTTRQQTAVPVTVPSQAELPRQDKEMSPKPGSLTLMKVSHTGKIEYLEQPIQKAKINRKICSKETVHVQRKQDNVGSKPSTSTGAATATGDISMKLEEFIMGSLKESLKGVDTSKLSLRLPENVKLPEIKQGQTYKIKIVSPAKAQQQNLTGPAPAQCSQVQIPTAVQRPQSARVTQSGASLLKPPSLSPQPQFPQAATQVRPGESLLKSSQTPKPQRQQSTTPPRQSRAISILKKPTAQTTTGHTAQKEHDTGAKAVSLLKSSVSRNQEPASGSEKTPELSQGDGKSGNATPQRPSRRSRPKSGRFADYDFPQTDGPADTKEKSGGSTGKKSGNVHEEQGDLASVRLREEGEAEQSETEQSTSSQARVYQKIRIIARPWRTPDGAVNRPILRMMLEGILTYIMTNPGLTHNQLVKKYNPILQPVCLTEILEILISIGCVTKQCFHKKNKTTLFSKRPVFCEDEKETSFNTVTYCPTVDCILKLGHFELQLQSIKNA